jgi:putative DNA methylase
MAQYRKKLIEVALPLEPINRESAREKSIRHGHPSTLHLWWARRPLAACRAVLFASIVDDPSSRPEEFPTEEDQERERQRLFRIIEELVKWENTNNAAVLEQARAEIAKATNGSPPPVIDPFCGGGSIPLEAQRLGLDAHASDLNPVAVLITKAMIEIPPAFASKPSMNPDARARFSANSGSQRAKGLADDVRYYGHWLRERAQSAIGSLYHGANSFTGSDGGVVAWLWVRTVRSPDPAFVDVDVPLVSSYIISTKVGSEAYIEPIVEGRAFRFEVREGLPADQDAAKRGTRAGKAQDFVCLLSGAPIPRSYIRDEGKAGRLGTRLFAVVVDRDGRRQYLSPTEAWARTLEAADDAQVSEALSTFLATPTPTRAMTTGGVCSAYGLDTWGSLFTPRQVKALLTFSEGVRIVRDQVIADGGDESAADAIATYLALAVDRCADYWSTIAGWQPGGFIGHTFARQAIPMTWDFAEANPFSEATGSWAGAVEWIARVIEVLPARSQGRVRQLDAAAAHLEPRGALVCTDPPYYDNIGYAELSDFFYVWLRHSAGFIHHDVFSTLLAPKEQELVATRSRFSGQREAREFFEHGLQSAFREMHAVSDPAYPLTTFYAFKQAESEDGAVASSGWDTMLTGLLNSGFAINGTWPMRTERTARTVSMGRNALASSIVLVCRPRREDAPIATRREFVNALRQELPDALRALQHGNIAPVDLAQAAIGPGMAVFSRYSKVLESDGTPMTVRAALVLINQALDEILSEQEGDFDSDTRFAVTWFEQHGGSDGPYGEADVLARAKDTSVNGMVDAGVLLSSAGKVRLLRRDEMPAEWDPVTDRRLTAWEAAQHLTRRLQTGGEAAAAELLRRLGGAYGEQARELAYRLYSICERKGWAQDALPYNALVVAWPEIARRVAGTPEAEAQQTLEM